MLPRGISVDYASLALLRRKALRNGNWALLSLVEKGLYRCALWVAKVRGAISNENLIAHVLGIAMRLQRSLRSRIADAGRRKARALLDAYGNDPDGVFSWAPEMREWLRHPRYVWYLGVLEVNG